MKIFKINDHLSVVANSERTRSGFRHIATLMQDGREIDSAKVTYQNRTWESYEFETVLEKLKERQAHLLNPVDVLSFNKMIKTGGAQERAELESQFKTTAMVAKMGEFFGKDQKEKNDWKERMLKAGLNLDMPEDWDTLSEEEKEKRLDAVLEHVGNVGKEKEKEQEEKKDYSKEDSRLYKTLSDDYNEEEEDRKSLYNLKAKKSEMPLVQTKLPNLLGKGKGWHKESQRHSDARYKGMR